MIPNHQQLIGLLASPPRGPPRSAGFPVPPRSKEQAQASRDPSTQGFATAAISSLVQMLPERIVSRGSEVRPGVCG